MRTIYVSPDFPLNRRMRKDIRRGKLQVVREGGERLSLGGGIPSGKGRGFRTTGSPLVCMADNGAEVGGGLGGGNEGGATNDMNNGANTPKLGKLEKGPPIKDKWTKEVNFSAWLAKPDGLALLGETLGMELDGAETEMQVGPFSADVVCRGVDGVVVVENQFGKTDHDHLGKLLTYSAGLESATIVWIAEEFVEQHRAALDWLNAQTVQNVRFFGLEVGLCKIGESPLALQFRIVSQPNDWTRAGGKSVKGQNAPANSAQERLCQKYWEECIALINSGEGNVRRHGQAPLFRPYVSIAQGGLTMMVVVTLQQGKIRAALRVSPQMFDALLKERDSADEEAKSHPEWDTPWEWKEPSGNQVWGYIRAVRENCALDEQSEGQWPEQHQWLKNQLELLYRVFHPRIGSLKASGVEAEDDPEE